MSKRGKIGFGKNPAGGNRFDCLERKRGGEGYPLSLFSQAESTPALFPACQYFRAQPILAVSTRTGWQGSCAAPLALSSATVSIDFPLSGTMPCRSRRSCRSCRSRRSRRSCHARRSRRSCHACRSRRSCHACRSRRSCHACRSRRSFAQPSSPFQKYFLPRAVSPSPLPPPSTSSNSIFRDMAKPC
jgi:hypothetical protein